MKKILLSVFLFLLTANVFAYQNGDWQGWNTDVEELKINDKTKLDFEEEFHWGDNLNEFYYQHYDVGIFYDLRHWLNIGAGYRQIYEFKKDAFKPEEQPYGQATLLWGQNFKFEDRNRMEYRHFNYQADFWRYRNKLTLKFPWKFTKLEIQPYLSDEIFMAFGGGNSLELNQNRFTPGLSLNLTKNLKAEIYYTLQDSKDSSGKWLSANILGTKLKFALN